LNTNYAVEVRTSLRDLNRNLKVHPLEGKSMAAGPTKKEPTDARRNDPITFSVILNRFNTIAREMTLTLEYSAWTTILAVASVVSLK
jgi:hypothetical protein